MEAELEMVWQSATAENRRLKESILDIKTNKPELTKNTSSDFRLLLND